MWNNNNYPQVIHKNVKVIQNAVFDFFKKKYNEFMGELNYNELWQIVLGEIELMVSKATYATWFKNTGIHDFKDGVVYIGVPNSIVKEWLEKKFYKNILKILRSYSDNIRNTEYTICRTAQQTTLADQSKEILETHQLKFKEFQIDKLTHLNPSYTLKSFIVGPFNELAHAAALNVIEKPGQIYNPLYIYGGVGLGKTHLLQTVGNEIKNKKPDLKIIYLAAQSFSDEYVENVRTGTTDIFRKKYKAYDVLIIDDVQFLGGKDKTQDELFHLFNLFQSYRKQAVFSSDCPPKLIPNIEDRLKSRFEGGMMADISKPDFESKMAILKFKAENLSLNFKDSILEYIAIHTTENIRELEGNLNIVAAELKIKKELTNQQLKDILNKNAKLKKIITPNQVIKKIANFYNINEKALMEKTRKKEIVKTRQIAMYILREDYNTSFPDIGRKFGGKDHTTAIHSCEKIANELKTNQNLNEEISLIRNSFLN